MNKTISHILLNSLLSIATMAIASGQDAQPALTADGNAGADVQSTSRIAVVQRAIVDRTNEFRKSNQLDAVQRDEHLMQAAKDFAEFMARTGKYGHRANDMTPAQRAEAAGYDFCVIRENIAPAHALDPSRRDQNLLAKPPVAGVHDDVTNSPGLFVDEQALYVADVAIARSDVIALYRFATAQVGVVILVPRRRLSLCTRVGFLHFRRNDGRQTNANANASVA